MQRNNIFYPGWWRDGAWWEEQWRYMKLFAVLKLRGIIAWLLRRIGL